MHLYKEQSVANLSSMSEFLLLEFSEVRETQLLHAFSFLLLYLAIIAGNLLIISAVIFDHHLHTPMYFFLMNLAIQDVGQVSVIIPKSIANSLINTRHISYSGCVAQVLFFLFFIASDISLLTVMAYDRYVAICNPLKYELVMNRRACLEMLISIWVANLIFGTIHTIGTFSTTFCSNVVKQFFCEAPQLLMLTCAGFNLIESAALVFSVVIVLGCFIFVVVTYAHIFTAVLRIPSVQGRRKAFSTCLPHLIVFSTFIFTSFVATFSPFLNAAPQLDLLFALIYSVVPPLLNPVIYSMRNKEVKVAMSKLLHWSCRSHNTLFVFVL